jgi:hypothetical protein
MLISLCFLLARQNACIYIIFHKPNGNKASLSLSCYSRLHFPSHTCIGYVVMAFHSARNSLLSFIKLRKYVKYLIYFNFVSTVFKTVGKLSNINFVKNRFSSHFMRKDGRADLICIGQNMNTLKIATRCSLSQQSAIRIAFQLWCFSVSFTIHIEIEKAGYSQFKRWWNTRQIVLYVSAYTVIIRYSFLIKLLNKIVYATLRSN